MQNRVSNFAELCARPESPIALLQEQGQGLFNLLIAPVLKELPVGSVLAVELDRGFANFPVEALYSGDGWYLGEKFPIIYSPGFVLENKLRKPKQITSSSALLLVDAASNLPGSDLEHQTVIRLFPKTKAFFSADEKGAFNTALSKASVFHFMGHAQVNLNTEELRVTPHWVLRPADFSPRATQHLQLAVLAACSTAQGGTYGLLDNRNLVHSFLTGAVPAVIASNWNVDSASTAELMRSFYAYVLRGEPPSIALFHARNQELRVRRHPYFWSGLNLIGEARK
jgi:CHAT domain-containing protein